LVVRVQVAAAALAGGGTVQGEVEQQLQLMYAVTLADGSELEQSPAFILSKDGETQGHWFHDIVPGDGVIAQYFDAAAARALAAQSGGVSGRNPAVDGVPFEQDIFGSVTMVTTLGHQLYASPTGAHVPL
jgi:hypothetical protein